MLLLSLRYIAPFIEFDPRIFDVNFAIHGMMMIYSFYCKNNNRSTYLNSTTLNVNKM